MELGLVLKNRRGGIMIEAVIASALLAVATVATARFARSATVLSHHADQRLTGVLAAENTIERLRMLPFEELPNKCPQVAGVVAELTGCDVDVKVQTFSSGDRQGQHCIVTTTPSDEIIITLHDWRFEPEATLAGTGENSP